MAKKVIIYFWAPNEKIQEQAGYTQEQELLDTDPFKIAEEVFNKGLQVMVFQGNEEGSTFVGIDDRLFRSR